MRGYTGSAMFFQSPEAPPPPVPVLNLELPGVASYRPELHALKLPTLEASPRPLKLHTRPFTSPYGHSFTYTGPEHFLGPGTDLLILLGLSILAHSTGGSVNLNPPYEVPHGLVQYPR